MSGPPMERGAAAESPRPERSAIGNAAWNAFSTLWGIAVAFLIAPVLIRNMGTDQYGLLLLVWSVTGLLGLVNFGFGEATLRYMAHYFGHGSLADVNRVMGATLTFYLTICVVVCIALFSAAPWLAGVFNIPSSEHGTLTVLFRLTAVAFALRALSQSYGAVPMALHRYDIAGKVSILQSVARTIGYIVLALSGFGIVAIIVWDIVTLLVTVLGQAIVIRRVASGVTLAPTFSFAGLREIIGFSVFSFLTFAFHMMHRESGKLILGAQVGAAPVAFLGTPDNVAHRAHMVVASGSETLMPRFSATSDLESSRALFRDSTWASLVVSLVLLLPLVSLMPDFLRLWISPDFALQSAAVGQLVAVSYISQGAYAPAATYFRGTGRPWVVTIAVAAAGIVTLAAAWWLVPREGLIGVGYAYLLGSLPAVAGTLHAWFRLLGRQAWGTLLRLIVLPVVMSGVAVAIARPLLSLAPEPGWVGLVLAGGLMAVLVGGLVVAADVAVNREGAPSRQLLERVSQSRKAVRLRQLLATWRSRRR